MDNPKISLNTTYGIVQLNYIYLILVDTYTNQLDYKSIMLSKD